jgi:hypothetical protein
MLRTKDSRQRDVRRRGESVDDVEEAAVEGSVIADDADSRAF